MRKYLQLIIVFCVCLGLLFPACKPAETGEKNEIEETMKERFEGNIGTEHTSLYEIKNKNGLAAVFTNYGQRLITLHVPDRDGKMEDVVLGFDSLKEYQEAKEQFFGAVVGRYGNRIANGRFSLDGNEYTLAKNNNGHHLHGGNTGFNSVVWKVAKHTDSEITFERTSPDMEEGYPGNLATTVHYKLTDENELVIKYEATTDKPTIVNLTHHSFFNLKGAGEGSINDHLLMINADRYNPVDAGLIPNGELADVAGTPFDFREAKTIGRDIEQDHTQLKLGNGYDHNFILTKEGDGVQLAARVEEPKSGRVMEVFTDEPGLQLYGGNFMDGKTVGNGVKAYAFRGAFCLESQHYPDSPNKPDFPSTRLDPGETYRSTCIYKFSTK